MRSSERPSSYLSCPAQMKGRIEHFASKVAMDMDGFGGQLVNQLVEKNLIRTVDDLFRLTFNDLIELDRIAEKSAQNILAAITIALFFDVSIEKIIKAIENYQPSNNRSQLLETKKNTLILDAYNANPSSLELAIDNFLNLKGKDKTFIIGSMLELGEASLVEHKKIIKLLSQQKNPCFFIGKEFINAAQNTNANHLSFYQTSKDFISSKLLDRIKNNLILLKGSRGIKLETLIPYL